MKHKTLRFAGEALEEPFAIGEHMTVRSAKTWPRGRIDVGEQVKLVAESEMYIGFAVVTNIAYDVQFQHLRSMDRLTGERTPYQEPEALIAELKKLYRGSSEESFWTVIQYETYLAVAV